jgi:hypothetical protein
LSQNIQRDHPVDNIFGDIRKGVTIRSHATNFCKHYLFVSFFEPFKVEDALRGPDWVVPMQEELNNIKHNEVWSLIKRSKQNVVGTNGYSVKSKMSMELSQGIKHDL